MFRPTLLALTSLLAAVNCAPTGTTSANPQDQAVKLLQTRNSVNDCGDSSFENKSSGGSPKVDDCRKIASNIAGGGTWTVAYYGTHQLVQFGTCAFNVYSEGGGSSVNYYVGNQDIIDVINTSIDKFQWNRLVGSSGTMNCQTPYSSDATVKWGLYHT